MRAYGWDDLDLKIGHHPTKIGIRWTVSKEARFELLDRLLEENHRRYAGGEPVGDARPDVTSFQVRAELRGPARARPAGPVGRAGGGASAGDARPPSGTCSGDWCRGSAADRSLRPTTTRDERPELSTGRWPRPASGDDGDDDDAGEQTPRSVAGSMAASAIGLAFSVPATVDRDQRGRAVGPVRAGSVGDARDRRPGRPRSRWHRVPRGGSGRSAGRRRGVGLARARTHEQQGVVVRYTVRHRGARRVVELFAGQRAAAAGARHRTRRGCTRWG